MESVLGCIFYSHCWDIVKTRLVGLGSSAWNLEEPKLSVLQLVSTDEEFEVFSPLYCKTYHAESNNTVTKNLKYLSTNYLWKFNRGVAHDPHPLSARYTQRFILHIFSGHFGLTVSFCQQIANCLQPQKMRQQRLIYF